LVEPLRAAVLNIGSGLVIFMKQNVIQLPHINHFATLLAAIEVLSLLLAQLVKVIHIHFSKGLSLSGNLS
jgi:hypothetical protein